MPAAPTPPHTSILIPWAGADPARRRAINAALSQTSDGLERLVLAPSPPDLPNDPRWRWVPCPGGGVASMVAAGVAAARGALCMIADPDADWAPTEAAARRALFPEAGAARVLALPRGGAARAGAAARPQTPGGRAAIFLFRDGAPPPLSAICAPTQVLRATRLQPGAGRWLGAALTLAAESAGARAEAPFGPWRDGGDAALEIGAACAALAWVGPMLTPKERLWAEMRLLGPALTALAPRDARRLGWRALLGGGAGRAALSLLTAHGAPVRG